MSVLPNPEEPPKIEIDPEEILRVYNLMGNLIEFFHQPMHYPDQQAVLDFLNSGVYDEQCTTPISKPFWIFSIRVFTTKCRMFTIN